MQQPPGFVGDPDMVCRLRKSIYGLKQAPRAWFHCLQQFLVHYGFVSSVANSSLFIYTRSGVRIFMVVYVDDIIVTGSCPRAVQTFIEALGRAFLLRDLGPLDYYLGIALQVQSDGALFLSVTVCCGLSNRYSSCFVCGVVLVFAI